MSLHCLRCSIILLLLFLFVSCQTTPILPRQFIVAIGQEPATLDPSRITQSGEQRLVEALFEGLVVVGPDGSSVVGGVAERWTVSPDGREYRFSLRPAHWSDGSPVTPSQFVDAWLSLLDPASISPQSWFPAYILDGGRAYQAANAEIRRDPLRLKALRNAVAVQALDEQTLWFRTSAAMPWVLQALCHPAFFPSSPQPGKAGRVGNGAYVLRDWQPGKRLVLDRSPTYWDKANVQLERVDFLLAEDQAAALGQYLQGEADWLPLGETWVTESVGGRPDHVSSIGLEQGFYLFDCRNPVLRDVRVRQALALAVDRQAVAAVVPGRTVLAVQSLGVSSATESNHALGNADLEKARALLTAAGFPGGKGFPPLKLLSSDSPTDIAVSANLQAQWHKTLNLAVTLRNVPRQVFLAERRLGNFDLARGGWQSDAPDDAPLLETFVSNAPDNDGFYNNPDFDTLLAKARLLQPGAERDQALHHAAAVLQSDAGVLALYTSTNANLINMARWGGWMANRWDKHNLKFLFRNK